MTKRNDKSIPQHSGANGESRAGSALPILLVLVALMALVVLFGMFTN